ncbi:MAG: carboxylate-amine ligase [Rhodovibrionaceae bacterium]|nr:carboxylate-amine ligase [Rhodovibrionaceae bacterium]
MAQEPSFTIGIEEEYLVVDPESRDLVSELPASLMEECERRLEGQVTSEFLRSQIEIGTRVCNSIREAREELAHLRRTVIEVTEDHGLSLIASSTHPFAAWNAQKHTDKERYNILARDMQAVARRLVICGMHVHVGLDDDELRIDLMNQVSYFLPHLLAMSTSSPFWRSEDTGLKCYRIAVFDELPRTGLPEIFESWGEFQRHLDILISAGLVEDASKLWWDVRPSARFPTLELRIPDICTRVDDGITVAAVYTCLLRMLYRLKRTNQRWRKYANMLVQENRWRAQRYGIDEGLVDFGKGEIHRYADLLDEILTLTREDQETADCVEECERAREIVRRGTSAHWQLEVYRDARIEGADQMEALRRVVDMLIEETRAGL